MPDNRYHMDLNALIEEDLSSYEYYVSLSPEMKRKLEYEDIHTLDDLQRTVEFLRREYGVIS